jgi:hypothetical protein
MIKFTVALKAAGVLFLAGTLAQSIAQGAELRGNVDSGGKTGNVSASLGGGGLSAKESATGPSSTSGSGSLSIGRGSGIFANSSAGTANSTNSNFTASIGSGNGTNGSTSFASGNNSLGFSFGQPGLPGITPGAGSPVPGLPGANLSGIAAALGDLSVTDKRRLAKKCSSVLAAPSRHERDTVIVCKVLASL